MTIHRLDGFALVGTDHAAYDQQKSFFERFKTSHKIECTSTIQKNYTLQDHKPVCYKCNSDLTERADLINLIATQK